MIEFNVAQLLKAPTGATRQAEVDELDQELVVDLHLVSPTRGSLRLLRTVAGILVTGTLSHQTEATCSRCLETFVRAQVIDLNDEFVPVIDVNTGLPLGEPEDPDTFRLMPNHLLNIDEAIRQYAILEEPLQLLCSADCRGLCSQCGANLNLGPCGCPSAPDDAPLGAIATLLAERIRQARPSPKQE